MPSFSRVAAEVAQNPEADEIHKLEQQLGELLTGLAWACLDRGLNHPEVKEKRQECLNLRQYIEARWRQYWSS